MTKPGFEPRTIEMKVGRSNHFTIRTLFRGFEPVIFQTSNYKISSSTKSTLYFELCDFHQKKFQEPFRTIKNINLTTKTKNLTRKQFRLPFCMKCFQF
jgi:hypothetical protein